MNKRVVVYYSLSGNTEEAARKIAEVLGAELLKLETVKPMPKSYAAQIFVGGGQVMMHHIPRLKPLGKDLSGYDEIILGSPIWNSKGVPAINAFLQDLVENSRDWELKFSPRMEETFLFFHSFIKVLKIRRGRGIVGV